jgi:hypothetical protein
LARRKTRENNTASRKSRKYPRNDVSLKMGQHSEHLIMLLVTKFHYKRKEKVLFLLFPRFKNTALTTHHCAVGFDCMDLTPPSTGTATIRLSKGDGDAMAWLLYL